MNSQFTIHDAQLSPRLSALAALVLPGSVAADIGTDHARLPIWLVSGGVCPRAVACDIAAGPLAAAARNIAWAGLAGRIQTRLGDGLAALGPGEADTVIIAGMGGENIAAILARCEWAKSPDIRWLLQPMTRPERLREYLYANGFAVKQEEVARERRRLYLILSAVYTGERKPFSVADCYTGALPCTPDGQACLRGVIRRLEKQAAGGDPEAGEILREIRRNVQCIM
ncbi:MAG: class I SAM-dependent methyltransferase [Oscillospiraceae bacterium]|nr:class I SAM-dependent methyltransferase [Oscillospiraceae bacterium]